jgi:Xaa-Pro aminopeptidase
VVDGYTSDMTRTIVVGEPSDEVRTIHSIVVGAVEAAVDAARGGMEAHKLDGAARRLIRARGYGAAFVHSLGHGVGMDVHEWPRISWNSDDVLPTHCVVTIEPGIYLEGSFGVRVEDMIVLRENGNECLTETSRELFVV